MQNSPAFLLFQPKESGSLAEAERLTLQKQYVNEWLFTRQSYLFPVKLMAKKGVKKEEATTKKESAVAAPKVL